MDNNLVVEFAGNTYLIKDKHMDIVSLKGKLETGLYKVHEPYQRVL